MKYPTLSPQPWQWRVCVRHAQVRSGRPTGTVARGSSGDTAVSGEQFRGIASVEYSARPGRRSSTAFIPRFEKSMSQCLQRMMKTCCTTGVEVRWVL